jgi:hypothetical protein
MLFSRELACVIVFVLNSIVVLKAQNIKVPQNAFLSHLLRDSSQIARIPLSKDPIIPQPSPFSKNFQQLIKSKSGLYLFGYLIIVFLNLKSLYLPVFETKLNRL